MTLIANFFLGDTPILIGDLMLSRTGAEGKHSKLPTYDDVSDILPMEWQRQVTGTHRKVCSVHQHLIVAWTGSTIYASKFISTLLNKIDLNSRISRHYFIELFDTAKSALLDYTEKSDINDSDLTLIGCFYSNENKHVQFKWTCNVVEFHEDPKFLAEGSGAENFNKIFFENDFQKNDTNSLNETAFKAVSLVSLLLGEEFATGSNIQTLYGGGYDIMLFVNGCYQFLNDVLVVPIFLEDMEKKRARMILPTVFFKNYYIKGNLVVARKIFTRNDKGEVDRDEITFSVIGKFGDTREDLEKLDYANFYKFESSIVSLIFLSKLSDGLLVYVPFVCKGSSYHIFEGGTFNISEEILKSIIPDLNRSIDAARKSRRTHNH